MDNYYKLLSLFDGIGCFPLAYSNLIHGLNQHQKFEYESSEIEDYLINILNSNFKNIKQLGDVTKIDFNTYYANSEKPNIITMGTPCTGFSISGKREGFQNIESKLFSEGIRSIEEIQPKYFIWENVFGVLSNNKGNEFIDVLTEFTRIGYNVIWTTYDMKYFGIPQRRRRVYLIGVRNDLQQSKYLKNIDPFGFINRTFSKEISSFQNKINKLYEINEFDNELYYFNRQRSDAFKAEGVASTLAKRDYKSFKDLIIFKNKIRRETPEERLKLQGIPNDWFKNASVSKESSLYRANGMSLPVVENVFESLFLIDKLKYNVNQNFEDLNQHKKNNYYVIDKVEDLKESKIRKEGRLAYSGVITKNENNQFEIHLIDSCKETKDIELFTYPEIKTLKDIFTEDADSKYTLSKKSIEGILRREAESGNTIPQRLRDKIKEIYKI